MVRRWALVTGGILLAAALAPAVGPGPAAAIASGSALSAVASTGGLPIPRVRPAAPSPRIGYVYGGGTVNSTFALITYAQSANGTLTRIGSVPDGAGDHRLALVHLRHGGLALYDLVGTYNGTLRAFRVNPVTGLLTLISTTNGVAPAVLGLAVYDPRALGLPGSPLLVTAAPCAKGVTLCGFNWGWFVVNPVTGALSPEHGVAPSDPNSPRQDTDVVGDGEGRFAVGYNFGQGGQLGYAKAVVTGSTTVGLTLPGVTGLADSATGQKPVPLHFNSRAMVITPQHIVQANAGQLQQYPDHPDGWVAHNFGASTGATYTSRMEHEVTVAVNGVGRTLVAEYGKGLPNGTCQIESFGAGAPGLGGAAVTFPCPVISSYSIGVIQSLFEQGGYLYGGRYALPSLSFRDKGILGGGLVPTAQKTVPEGQAIYGWTGFLLAKPTVAVPAHVSAAAGIPVTVSCSQTCFGSSAATLTLAGTKAAVPVPALTIVPHAAGTFIATIHLPAAVRSTVLQALTMHRPVSATTTTHITAGVNAVKVVSRSSVGR